MKAKVLIGACIASSLTSIVHTATPSRADVSPLSLVAHPAILDDMSDDGRWLVLTRNFTYELVDRQTGQTVSSSSDPLQVSGDGSTVFVTTNQQLDPVADTDTSADVYSRPRSGGPATLVTPGFAGSSFYAAGGSNFSGSAVVVVRRGGGADNNFDPKVAVGGQLIGLPLPAGTYAVPFGISDDGNLVLYGTYTSCPFGPCAVRGLQLFNRTTLSVTSLALDQANQPLTLNWAVLSGDGRCVAYVVPAAGWAIVRDCELDGHGDTVDVGPASAVGGGVNDPRGHELSISRDGSTMAWMEEVPTDVSGQGTSPQAQWFAKVGAGEAAAVSVPATGNPNGWTAGGILSADGTELLFNTRASNLAGGPGDNAYRVVSWKRPATLVSGASAFTPRTPFRILDTRIGLGYAGDMPKPGTSIAVPIRHLYGVPADASAVALQVTAAGGSGAGYISAIPGGSPPGLTSTLNLDTAGEMIANMAVVPLGADGSVTLYTNAATHVIVDIAGWWTPVTTATMAGRYKPVGPSRILDTRPTSLVNYAGAKPSSASTTTVQVSGTGGVPSSGAAAVSVNVTLADPESAGFVQVGPAADLVVGASSTLNVSTAGQVIAAAAIVPLDAAGRIAIYSQPGTHLIVDVNGWFTDSSAAAGTDGLLVPAAAVSRQVDTRPPGTGYSGPKPSINTRFDTGAIGAAIVGNLTVVETAGPGFVQLGPAATMTNGATSNINVTAPNEVIANAFIAPAASGVGVYTSNGTHIVIDVSGYVTS